MKLWFPTRRILVGLMALSLVSVAGAAWWLSHDRAEFEEADEDRRGPDEPDKALQWKQIFERDEKGVIDPDGLVNAQRRMNQMRAQQIGGYASPGDPPPIAGISNGGWTGVGPGNIGGRTRGLAIHPTTTTTMFAGSVAGGIWRTTNGGASWAAINDFMANLAVSTIVFRPGNPAHMFAGTGEGFFNFDQIRGAGIFRSTDTGATWTQLPATANTNFFFVTRLAMSADGNILLATTSTGVYQSLDQGTTWGSAKLAVANMADVKFVPGSSTQAVASGYSRNAYYTVDGGATWNPAATGLVSGGVQFGRVELGVSASSPGIIWASYNAGGTSSATPAQIFKSVDFGVNYVQQAVTPNHLAGQGWYDNVIWVDPTNPDVVVVGGVDLWRTVNGGVNWQKISTWSSAPVSAHADHHMILHHPGYNGTSNRIVYFGNDGGVYRADDVLAAVVGPGIPFQELNNSYSVTQFYGGDGLLDGRLYGGTQDNGTVLYSPGGGSEAWVTIAGGDGGFAAADRTNNMLYGEFQNLVVHRSTNGGASVQIHGCSASPTPLNDTCIGSTNFIAPLVIDPSNVDRLYAGGTSLWRASNARTASAATVAWSNIKASIASPISAIAVAPNNSDVIWVGHNNGNVYRTTNGTQAVPVWTQRDTTLPPLPNRAVASIAIDPADANHVFVSFGGFSSDNIWVTTNGGDNWTDATGSGGGDLPAVPVRWVAVHPSQTGWVYAATDVGVFASENGGTSWQIPHDGPANVAVFQLFWVNTTLVAVTHGRGMFTASVTPSNTPPAINSHPASQTIGTGTTALLSVGASGSAPLTFQWYNGPSPNTASPIPGATSSTYTTPALVANASYWVRVTNPFGVADSNTATITVVAFATFDPTLQAPKCTAVGNNCDSGPVLLNGRDTLSGGAEPNQPNTIMDVCSDGTQGIFHDDESNDRLRVFTLDGTPFAPGKTVQVDATVWAYPLDFVSDALDLYYAANANSPVWTPIATGVIPAVGGQQVISRTFVLPAGGLQAVRARFRYLGAPGTCTGGTAHFDDHDDLIFAVGAGGGTELIVNGDFAGGMANWTTFENPAGSGNFAINGGQVEFTRNAPAPGTINQATIFQATGVALGANTPLTATFQIGNSGPAPKYMKVLIVGDLGFTDLGACAFWLRPNTPLTTFSMKTHTTQPASNISLYFYASSVHSTGGTYLLDNASLQVTPGDSIEQTLCVDPFAPGPPGGAVGPDLVLNGSFQTGTMANWTVLGPVTSQINPTGNVLEFIRTASPNPPAVPPAVVLQATAQAMAQNQIMTATFMLGNSSPVRKRVLILLHDASFGDLVACTWWLSPGQALSRYVMKAYASIAWTNATVAIYPATTGPDQWIRVDDITLQRTPASTNVGAECLEGSLAVGPEPNGGPAIRRHLNEPPAELPEVPDALAPGHQTPTRGRTRGRRTRT